MASLAATGHLHIDFIGMFEVGLRLRNNCSTDLRNVDSLGKWFLGALIRLLPVISDYGSLTLQIEWEGDNHLN